VTDAIVVGAGPAGCLAAIVLARAGARVRLLDRSRFPRRKLCGDTVNPGARAILARLGLEAEVLRGGLAVRGMTVTGGGISVTGVYPAPHRGVAITRAAFDERLVHAAARAGVAVEEATSVSEPLVEGSAAGCRVTGVRVSHAGGTGATVSARICIAADGRHSRLAFPLRLARHPAWPRRWAVGAYYTQVGAEGEPDLGEMHIRAGHYVGVAQLPEGLFNACLVTADRARLRDPERALRGTLSSDPFLRDRFAAARRVSPVAVLGPLAVESRRCGMPGLLLAGDAAGFVDPMTGDGLRFALRSGELAAQAALDALDHGGPDAHRALARRYREFRGKRTFNRALRRLVDSPRAVSLAAQGARLAPAVLRRLIRIAGDIPATHAA
jgi:geranylgeranyl reductase family protein